MQQDGYLEYGELDRLVKFYQQGDNEAALLIVKAFSGYLTRFLSLVKYGYIDFGNYGHRQFISLFVRNRYERIRILSGINNDSTRRLVYETAAMVANQFKPYSKEDIWSELTTELLIMAKNYKNDLGYFFHTYVSKAFPFRIFKRLSVWINDVTNMIARNWDRPDMDTLEEDDFADGLIEDLDKEEPLLLIPDNSDEVKLDENWINGQTCSEAFSVLTPLERRVLIMYYQEGYTDREIGEQLGYRASSIQQIRSGAVSKLRKTQGMDEVTEEKGAA